MNKLTVLIDLDDVLWDLVTPWVDAINFKYGTNVAPNTITEWDITSFFPWLTSDQVYSPLYQIGFWETIQTDKYSHGFINVLQEDGHDVKVVTASFFENIDEKMKRMFHLYPMLSRDDVIITTDKKIVRGDVLIDDAPHNLEGGDFHKILLTKLHNIKYDAEKNGIVRVQNLLEAYREICEYANCRTMAWKRQSIRH